MTTADTLKRQILPRLPGLAGLTATGIAFQASYGTPVQPLIASMAALVGLVGLLVQSPSKGAEAVRGRPGGRGRGAFLVGHASEDRHGGAIGLRWADVRGGLVVEGDSRRRHDLIAGIAVQALAAGEGGIYLANAREDAHLPAFRALADYLDQYPDLTVVGHGPRPIPLAPFLGLSPETVAALVARGAPSLYGDGPQAVRARALLDTARCLYASRLAMGTILPGADAFEGCMSLRSLAYVEEMEEHPAALKGSVRRYLEGLPGYAPEKNARQAQHILDRHSEAVAILSEGVSTLREPECPKGRAALAAGDLVAPGRFCLVRREGAAADLVLALVRAVLTERPDTAIPPILVDDAGNLSSRATEDLCFIRDAGGWVVAGASPTALASSRTESLRKGAHAFIALAGKDGTATMTAGGSAGRPGRRFWPLPLDRGRVGEIEMSDGYPARIDDPDRNPQRVRITAPAMEASVEEGRLTKVLGAVYGLGERDEEDLRDVPVTHEGLAGFGLGTAGEEAKVSCILLRDILRPVHVPGPKPEPAVVPEAQAGLWRNAYDYVGDDGEETDADLDFPAFDETPPEGFDGMFDFEARLDRAFDSLDDLGNAPSPRAKLVVFPKGMLPHPGLHGAGVHRLAGKPLGLQPALIAGPERSMLDLEFPHFAQTTARIIEELERTPGHARFRPVLLHGPNGVGKTRYARRLCETLMLDWRSYPCGGVSDGAFGGAAPQWDGARSAAPIALVMETLTANPCLVLDELDKASTGSRNGSIQDLLPGLLDPETSARYQDPYLGLPVNLSEVLWIATANDLSGFSKSVIDRFRVETIPEPGPEHCRSIAERILDDIADGGGAKVEGSHRAKVLLVAAREWPGGSVRSLRALVEDLISKSNGSAA